MRAALAAVVVVVFSIPLLVMATGSLRQAGLPPPRGMEILPHGATTENFSSAWSIVDLGHQLLISLLVAAVVVPVSVVVSSWAAWAITQGSRRVSGPLIGLALVALMVPATSLLVGRFLLYDMVGLNNTLIPLMAPALMGLSPFFVLVFAWSFRRIPPELVDLARIEGASWLGAWWRVALPLSRPTVVAVAMLAFTASWSNFVDPLIHVNDPDLYPVSLGLRQLAEVPVSDGPIFLAGALIATVPAVVLLIAAQRSLFATQAQVP